MIEASEMEHGMQTSDRGRAAGTAGRRPGASLPGGQEEFPLDLRETTLAAVCRSALDDVAARFPNRLIAYAPDPEAGREGAGEWDPRRVTYAVTILLEDALKRTRETDLVSVRWREHEGVVALRVQYPRPLERGDQLVTCFEHGVQPDGADDAVGTLRILAALRIARQHGGHLARVRTRAGTAYVLELPRRQGGETLPG
ncbi:histidine kinase [Anaeromyxobacter paludicola]|uniref:Histidine kinase n=1 Tax=Anaeromyxobacter paludicola TaxID=2918171 RepID=A0ABN6NBW2_9BACT|nr:sensor histidine kinase [Anaeromyxobacter paludicola]BDG10752.1 hypothetical protein AMPC_38650 [Anaeromyxobacter paludicola]